MVENVGNSIISAQYTATGAFVGVCKCEIHETLAGEPLLIKEATTGYSDQENGNFVTYVIEFGVRHEMALFVYDDSV